MIVIGDDTQTQQANNRQKDSQQDTRLDSLQTAVDSLNAQVSAINASIQAINATIDDKYSAQTQSLMSALTSQINALSSSLASVVNTAQVNANVGNFGRLAATISATLTGLTANIATITEKATIEEAEINTLDVNTANVGTLAAVVANLETANIELLNVTSFVVSSLTVETLAAGEIDSDEARIRKIESNKIKTRNITGKEWHTPISTPDNTELLHISIPKYKGVIQMQTEDDEFNVTIFNDSSLTFNQSDFYIYRVERNDESIDIYLQNVGNTINYRILHIGSESFEQESSELVDRTLFVRNVDQLHDVVFFSSQDKIVKSNELGYLIGLTANVQEQINGKQPKQLETPIDMLGDTYYSVESLLEQMSAVLAGMVTTDIIYREDIEGLFFPYNSIQYDAETESVTIIGFHVEYRDGQLFFTKI